MEQPITIRFRWTADELLQGNRYHFRHRCRPVFRFGMNAIFAFSVLGGAFGVVLALATSNPDARAGLPVYIVMMVVGVYWFAIKPFVVRWIIRRQFSKRPDQNMEVEWQASADKILITSELAQSEIRWHFFAKMVQTPIGVMLYPFDKLFHWLPRHGFASDAEFERFVDLAKSKVPRFYDVG